VFRAACVGTKAPVGRTRLAAPPRPGLRHPPPTPAHLRPADEDGWNVNVANSLSRPEVVSGVTPLPKIAGSRNAL